MTLEQYRRQQDAVTLTILDLVRRLLRAVGARPLSPERFSALVDALLPAVLAARSRSFELSRQIYAEVAEVDVGELPEVPQPHYERLALVSAIDRTARARLATTVDALDDPQDATTVEQIKQRAATATETAASTAAAAVARHVEMAGRDGIVATSRADRRALGWARVGTGRENCAFCTMLISRGPVYKTAREAGVSANDAAAMATNGAESMLALMSSWHDGCDCIAVPVFDENDWPGREQFLEADQLWVEVTSRESGVGKLRALRQALDEQRGPAA